MKKRSRQGLLSLLLVFALALVFLLWQQATFFERSLFAESELVVEDLPSVDGPCVRLAAMGDVRSGGWSQQAVSDVLTYINEKAPLNGIILLGDNLALWGNPKRLLQERFLDPYATLIAKSVPFYAVLGNHDLSEDMKQHQLNFPYYNMNGRPYYSKAFGKNCAEVFFINSNNINEDPQQVQWLRQALTDSRARWKVVAMHHPLYATAKRRQGSHSLSKLLEPIFVEAGVDVVVSGHNHIYERLYPINGITYITAGSGGELRKGELQPDNPFRATGNDQENVALLLQLTPDTCRFLAYSGAGKLVDTGVIEKERVEYAESR